MNLDCIALLRSDLLRAEFTETAVRDLLGEDADFALRRGVRAAARIALAAHVGVPDAAPKAALRSLVQLFLLGDPVTKVALDGALPALGVTGACSLGIVSQDPADAEALRPVFALTPFHARGPGLPVVGANWWILSDLDDHVRNGPARSDHVMGVGGATRSLLGFAIPGHVASALDLGTGCGVIALHLAARADRVVATDISQRALDFATANAALNEIEGIEWRRGDLFAPVAERFDLIVSNPPFVITPRVGVSPAYEYRDGGLAGDDLMARVIQSAPAHLVPGGIFQSLGNWEVRWGSDGLDRVLGWVANAPGVTPGDACWIIERDRESPERYAEVWARDGGARIGGEEFERLVASWLNDFAGRRVVAIGLGLIGFRRALVGNTRTGPRRAERAGGAIGGHQRLGDSWAQNFADGVDLESIDSEDFGGRVFVRAGAVREERVYEPGHKDPASIVLASDTGISRRLRADTVLAAAVGVCDGDLTVDEIGAALSDLLDADPAALREALHSGLRELIWCGMLRPAGPLSVSAPANSLRDTAN
jgi:methylase of polypeptide subunit release factors